MNGTDEFVGFMKQVSSVWPSGIDISIKIGPQATYTAAPPVVAPAAAPVGRSEEDRLREALEVADKRFTELYREAALCGNQHITDTDLIRDQDDAIKAATARIVFLQKQILELTNEVGFVKQKAAQLSDLSVQQAVDLKRWSQHDAALAKRNEELKAELEEGRRNASGLIEKLASAKRVAARLLDACFCEDGGKPECDRCVKIRSVWEKL